MTIVYLVGGTGNQLFQYGASDVDDKYSTLFLSKAACSILGWSHHERLFEYKTINWALQIIAMIGLLGDLLLLKMLDISLVTEFDLRGAKKRPLIKRLIKIGYFQNAEIDFQKIYQLGEQFKLNRCNFDVVLHIRGGDIIKSERSGFTQYGLLNAEYYSSAIEKIKNNNYLEKLKIICLTDDLAYAKSLLGNLKYSKEIEIHAMNLRDSFESALGSKYFISSNSTLSYWLVKLRGEKGVVIPEPFQKNKTFEFGEGCIKLKVSYK